jgi:hypothetical protein
MRLDGAVRSVNPAQNSLVMDATSFTLPNGKTSQLPAPKPKTILVTAQTLIHLWGKVEEKVALGDLKVGRSVTVVGKDAGSGKELTARVMPCCRARRQSRASVMTCGSLPNVAMSVAKFCRCLGRIAPSL